MRLAWMKFEYGPAMKRLMDDLSSNPDFWMSPPLKAMDEKIAYENRMRLLHLRWPSYHDPWDSGMLEFKGTGKIREIGVALERLVAARSLADDNLVAGKIAGENSTFESFPLAKVDSATVGKGQIRSIDSLKIEGYTAWKPSLSTKVEAEEVISAATDEDDFNFDTKSVKSSASWETISSTESEPEYVPTAEVKCNNQTVLQSSIIPTSPRDKKHDQPHGAESWSKIVKGDEEEVYYDCGDGVEESSVNGDDRRHNFVSGTKGQDAMDAGLQFQDSLRQARAACVQDISDLILYGVMVMIACVAVFIVWFLRKVLLSTWD
jgi:hypothetical protein